MRVLVCFSMSEDEALRLAEHGPRRDIMLLAGRLGATLLYRKGGARGGGRWLKRLWGPHMGHAWIASDRAKDHDVVFADGEHVGLPLLLFLRLRRRRSRVVILGHLIDRPWKRAMLWLGTRLVGHGALVLHSVVQADIARRVVSRSWTIEVLPYQVDTQFWTTATEPAHQGVATVIAVGSEHRDYETLAAAVRGLDVRVRIAAGSHWARSQAKADDLPLNVRYEAQTLPFAELRSFYETADIVVVPLHPVGNQSGVTTILEAMSMSRPVIVTATPGQREIVTGPLIRATEPAPVVTADRGPQSLGLARDPEPTGWYVEPHDVPALRAAICGLAANPALRTRLGAAGRASVERNFRTEQFAERFARVISTIGAEQ